MVINTSVETLDELSLYCYTHTHTFMVILLYINIKFILLIKKNGYTVIQVVCWVELLEQRRLCPIFVKI